VTGSVTSTCINVNGSLAATDGTFLNYCVIGYSDDRLKQDKIDLTNCVDDICRLSAFEYTPTDWARDNYNITQKRRYGLSAQQVQQVFPEAVVPFIDDYLSVDYTALVPILCKCIKELNSKIETIKCCDCHLCCRNR
jgi:hypothetical protein